MEDSADNEKHLRRLAMLRRRGYWGLLFWPVFLLAGGMAFDAPGSERKIAPYLILGACAAYGILPFLAPGIAKKALIAGRIKLAYVLAAIPCSVLPVVILVNLVIYCVTLAGL